MSIETRIQAINDHLIDDYKVLRLAGADLSGVNKNIVNLKMSWKERLLYFMNNGTQEVWDNWDKVNGTGTTLSLSNTEEAPMSLTYKGNTSQSGTPTPSSPIPVQVVSGDNSIEVVGVNIFDEVVEAGYINSTTGQNVDGYDNYRRSKNYIKVIPGQTYYLYLGDVANTAWVGLESYSANKNWLSHTAVTTKNTFTVANNCEYIRFYMSTNYYDKVCINVSNASINGKYYAYESASYPISLGDKELCKIGTYQDKIDKSTGKNLFDISNFTLGTSNGITATINGDHLVLNGTASSTAYVNFTASNFNGTCTWGIRSDVALGNLQIQRTGAGVVNIAPSTTWNKSTLDSTNVTGGYLSIPSGTTLTNCKVYLYVGEGTLSSIDYEPYGTGWYLKKEIGKYTFTGSENWVTHSYGTNSWALQLLSTVYNANKLQIISNIFKGIPASERSDDQTNILYFTNDTIIVARNTTFTTKADIQSGTNGNYVYYALATPTYETITDTTLLSQLEALKKSYESVTNISQVNNDMPFELSVTALEVMS